MDVAAPSPAARPETVFVDRRTRLSARAAVLAVLVLIVLAFAVSPLRALMLERAQVEQLEQQAAVLQRANRGLGQQISRLNDPAYIERLARECLGMSYPGETSFVLIPDSGGPLPNDC